jgi:glucose-1-phosphate thymidylyltransferase
LLLAGGTGSRLAPLTRVVNKHLLPVFDKPMIYYPLTTLMLAGIRETTIVTARESRDQFVALLGDGAQWGLKLTYRIQDRPDGIAAGLRIATPDLRGHSIALILGDNIFFGAGLADTLETSMANNTGATIFGCEVADPCAFGVVTLDHTGRPTAIEEKPANPKSRIAVTGLYLYAADVLEVATQLSPSERAELEITDVNRLYLEQHRLRVHNLGRGVAWLDGGTPEDLYEASQFVKVIQDRTGLRVACPEEIAYRRGFIDRGALARLAQCAPASDYRTYLLRLLEDPLIGFRDETRTAMPGLQLLQTPTTSPKNR